jgi:hypothetical protein
MRVGDDTELGRLVAASFVGDGRLFCIASRGAQHATMSEDECPRPVGRDRYHSSIPLNPVLARHASPAQSKFVTSCVTERR